MTCADSNAAQCVRDQPLGWFLYGAQTVAKGKLDRQAGGDGEARGRLRTLPSFLRVKKRLLPRNHCSLAPEDMLADPHWRRKVPGADHIFDGAN